jgi:hypothetical protein
MPSPTKKDELSFSTKPAKLSLRKLTHEHGPHAIAGPGVWTLNSIRLSVFEQEVDRLTAIIDWFAISLRREDVANGSCFTVGLLKTNKKEWDAGVVVVIQMRMMATQFFKAYGLCEEIRKHHRDFESFDKVWPSEKCLVSAQERGEQVICNQSWIGRWQ